MCVYMHMYTLMYIEVCVLLTHTCSCQFPQEGASFGCTMEPSNWMIHFALLATSVAALCTSRSAPPLCVAVCCSELQCVAVSCSELQWVAEQFALLATSIATLCKSCNAPAPYIAVSCSVLQYAAVCCSEVQCVAVQCSALKWVAGHFVLLATTVTALCTSRSANMLYNVVQWVAVRCSELHCAAVCSVLQCAVVYCRLHIPQCPATVCSMSVLVSACICAHMCVYMCVYMCVCVSLCFSPVLSLSLCACTQICIHT